MTTGGGGNDINLAALWVPVMPETSQLGPAMRKAGESAKAEFTQGFQGGGGGSTPEAMGTDFGNRMKEAIGASFMKAELPLGLSKLMELASSEVDSKLSSKLTGSLSAAVKEYTANYNELAAAQAKAEEATRKYNLAVDNGFNKASITLPLLSQQRAAQTELAAATERTAASHEKLSQAQSANNEFMKQNSVSGNIFAGVMGGAVAVGIGVVTSLFEKAAELGVEMFKGAIESAHELADYLIEVGESYENLEHQIELFSSAGGEQLEAMNASAARVFGTLDVAGDKVGQTMAILGSRLNMEAGPALEKLTHDVTELQGRFGALDVNALSAIMVNFKVPADQVENTLASLVQSGRSAGVSIGDMVTALDTASPLLAEAGLNAEQAGAFIADMTDHGLNARQMMTGLGTAQATFSKHNLDFKDGMNQAADELQHFVDVGDTADADALAQKLFGSRNWASALQMIKSYNDVVDEQPGKYAASADSLQELFDNTQTLSNKWEEVKHHIEEALAPIGLGMVTQIGKGFDQLTDMFERNRSAIVEKIKSIGDTFISMLPEIQSLGVEAIKVFGAMGEAALKFVGIMATSFGTFGHQAGDIMSLIPGMRDQANELIKASDAVYDMGQKTMGIKFSDDMNNIADWIKNLNIDVPGLTDKWDNLTNSMKGTPTIGGGGQGIGGQGSFFNPGGGGDTSGAPAAGPGDGSGGQLTVSGGVLSAHGATASGSPRFGGPGGVGTGGGGPGQHVADWDAIAVLESSSRWNELLSTGVTNGGGLQIKPDTWKMYGGPELTGKEFAYQATKDQQIAIANRILNGWNGMQGQGPQAWQNGETYRGSKDGGTINGSMSMPDLAPNSRDTVPMWTEPGEEVIAKGPAEKYRNLLKLINAGGFQGGGTSGLDTKGVQVDTIAVAQAAQQLFGINDIGMLRDPDGYNEHASGEAADIMVGGNASMGDQVAQYFLNNADQFGVQYVLWHQTQMNPDGTSSKMEDRGSPTANHMDHVHVRTLGGGYPPGSANPTGAVAKSGSSSSTPAAAALSGQYSAAGGGGGGGGFPGLPGQYGGLGAYGGQTADQAYQTAAAVKDAKDRAADQDYAITQKQADIARLQKAYDDLKSGDKGGLLGDPDIQKKLDAAQKQVADATHDLGVLQRERADQDGKISEAERKQMESSLQAPDKQKVRKATGAEEFQQLGGGLLKGVMGDLGLGDVFGKSPLDWGIVKLLGGMANWGIGTANAWADEIGKGHTGVTGNQPIPGWDSGGGGGGGLGSLMNGMFPGVGSLLNTGQGQQGFPGVSNAPNIAVDPTGSVHGAGGGQPPGSVIGGDYQPVNVTNNGPKQSDYDAWKAGQNTRTAGAMSGLPGGG